jgi:hypothetical protein
MNLAGSTSYARKSSTSISRTVSARVVSGFHPIAWIRLASPQKYRGSAGRNRAGSCDRWSPQWIPTHENASSANSATLWLSPVATT